MQRGQQLISRCNRPVQHRGLNVWLHWVVMGKRVTHFMQRQPVVGRFDGTNFFQTMEFFQSVVTAQGPLQTVCVPLADFSNTAVSNTHRSRTPVSRATW